MNHVALFIALLAAVIFFAALARRLPVPYPVVLVLGGLALAFVPGAPHVSLSPTLVFFIFLPPLAYAAAFLVSFESLTANVRSIGPLATGLVVATMAAVAVVAHVLIGLPWSSAFVLGAVLGPTDAVAATAIARRIGAPPHISSILQGEALVNDGTGLAVFKIAVATVGAGSFSVAAAVGEFFEIAAGGIVVGLVTGYLAARVRRRLDEPELEITTALVSAYGAYILADHFGFSGVLASVTAGLYARRSFGDVLAATSRLQSASFWSIGIFMLESLLFLLIGLESPQLFQSMHDVSLLAFTQYALWVAATAIALRFAWMFTIPYLRPRSDRGGDGRIGEDGRAGEDGRTGEDGRPPRLTIRERLPARDRAVLGWAGMRGGVSLAAALSIPLSVGGTAFPDRAIVILLAYTTVLATLLIPALSLPVLIAKLGLAQGERERKRGLAARLQLVEAALARADELARDGSELEVPRARELYELRLHRLAAELGRAGDEDGSRSAHAYWRVRKEMIGAERDALRQLRSERRVSSATVREIERELDLDESRLTR